MPRERKTGGRHKSDTAEKVVCCMRRRLLSVCGCARACICVRCMVTQRHDNKGEVKPPFSVCVIRRICVFAHSKKEYECRCLAPTFCSSLLFSAWCLARVCAKVSSTLIRCRVRCTRVCACLHFFPDHTAPSTSIKLRDVRCGLCAILIG